MKIIIVDDSKAARDGLSFYLTHRLHHEVIAIAESGEEILLSPMLPSADFILMDIMMPNITGLDTTKYILWDYPYLKIIAITMHVEKAFLKQMVQAGFKGCVFKHDIYNKLPEAFEQINEGKLYFPDDIKLDE